MRIHYPNLQYIRSEKIELQSNYLMYWSERWNFLFPEIIVDIHSVHIAKNVC